MDERFNWRQIAAVKNGHRRRRRRVTTPAACRSSRRRCFVVSGRGTVARARVGVQQAAPGAVLAGRGNVGTTTPQSSVDVGQQPVAFGADVDELFVGGQFYSPDTLGVRPDSLHCQPVTGLHWQSLHVRDCRTSTC